MSVTRKPIQWKLILGLLSAATSGLALLLLPSLVQANVDLLYFRAVGGTDVITLEWETASELDNLGFNLYRSTTGSFDDAIRLNSTLIPSQVGGQPIGAFYQFPDGGVVPDIVYTYWLEDIDFNGDPHDHDPVQSSLVGGNTIPTQPAPPAGSTATPTSTRTPTATATATAATSGTNATATSTRTPVAAGTATNAPPPTATVAAASQSQAQPTANRPQATPASTSPTANQATNGYPAPASVDQSQPDAVVNEGDALASNPPEANPVESAPARNSPDSDQQAQSTAISAAPIGSGSQPQSAQDQQSSDGTSGTGFPEWLIIVLVAGLLLAVAAGAATLFVLNQESTK